MLAGYLLQQDKFNLPSTHNPPAHSLWSHCILLAAVRVLLGPLGRCPAIQAALDELLQAVEALAEEELHEPIPIFTLQERRSPVRGHFSGHQSLWNVRWHITKFREVSLWMPLAYSTFLFRCIWRFIPLLNQGPSSSLANTGHARIFLKKA